jgi:hypothetical protein
MEEKMIYKPIVLEDGLSFGGSNPFPEQFIEMPAKSAVEISKIIDPLIEISDVCLWMLTNMPLNFNQTNDPNKAVEFATSIQKLSPLLYQRSCLPTEESLCHKCSNGGECKKEHTFNTVLACSDFIGAQ